MTPEEIVDDLHRYHKISPAKAIEAIHQYAKDFAKQMCDKQRKECVSAYLTIDGYDVVINAEAIENAPYPNELI